MKVDILVCKVSHGDGSSVTVVKLRSVREDEGTVPVVCSWGKKVLYL